MVDLGVKGLSQENRRGIKKKRKRRRREVERKGVIKCNQFYDCVYASNNTACCFYFPTVLWLERR